MSGGLRGQLSLPEKVAGVTVPVDHVTIVVESQARTIGAALVLAEVRTKDVTRVIERNVD